jgi:CubicO group peptidase (beta-lactamase class C family)
MDFSLAADYSRRRNGLALLVQEKGQIVFEEYTAPLHAGQAYAIASGTKGFSGALALAAMDDGLLRLDEAAVITLPEWEADAVKTQITIRDLLQLVSGLEPAPKKLWMQNDFQGNKNDVALSVPALTSPKKMFAYGPTGFYVFGEILRRKLQTASVPLGVVDYLNQRILQPIGSKIERWCLDASGNPDLSSGASMTARDWLRFGQLVLRRGLWNEKQILKADGFPMLFEGSEVNPAYGLGWWLNCPAPRAPMLKAQCPEGQFYPGGPADLAIAAGLGKQRMYVLPSLDRVIIRLGNDSPWSDAEFLRRLLEGQAQETPLEAKPDMGLMR